MNACELLSIADCLERVGHVIDTAKTRQVSAVALRLLDRLEEKLADKPVPSNPTADAYNSIYTHLRALDNEVRDLYCTVSFVAKATSAAI